MSLPSQVVCALVQSPPVFLNLAASTELATEHIRVAAERGAQLVVFPETWLPGYPVWLDLAPGSALWRNEAADALFSHYFANSPTSDGAEMQGLRALASELQVDIVLGFSERAGKSLYNSTALLGSDGSSSVRRKLMPTFNEKLIWGQGDGSTMLAAERPYGRVGSLICWEHWMPLARAAMHAQHEDLHIAQWPAVGELHQLASRHYAFEGQTTVIAAGTCLSRADVLAGYGSAEGPEAGRELLEALPDAGLLKNGGSAVIAPDAEYRFGPVFDRADLFIVTLDLGAHAGIQRLDVDGHYARPDIFSLAVNRSTQRSICSGREGGD